LIRCDDSVNLASVGTSSGRAPQRGLSVAARAARTPVKIDSTAEVSISVAEYKEQRARLRAGINRRFGGRLAVQDKTILCHLGAPAKSVDLDRATNTNFFTALARAQRNMI